MTTAANRNIIGSIFSGYDLFYAPFISTSSMRKANARSFRDIHHNYNLFFEKTIPQLLGNNGEDFHYYASVIRDMGYKEVNWNIGCPYGKVTRKKKGSGLLEHPDDIKNFLDIACKDLEGFISVKMRLGLNTPEDGEKVIDVLNGYPLKNIIIHGRIASQLYTGEVNLDCFEHLYNMSQHQVVYNGDIYSVEDYHRIQARFPEITDFMLGRGALRNPLLAAEIKGKTFTYDERMKFIQDYHQSTYDYYRKEIKNDNILINKMKEYWSYMAYQLPEGEAFFDLLASYQDIDDYLKLMNSTF